MEKIKILFLTYSLAIGGAERQLALLVKYLPHNWERRVYSLSSGPYIEKIQQENIRVIVNNRSWRFDLFPFIRIWLLIIKWRPDIVHSIGWMCTLSAGPICRLLRIPLIDGSVRIGMAPRRRKYASYLSLKWASRVIANSKAGLIAWKIGFNKGRIIYNGFDQKRLDLHRDAYRNSNSSFTVVMCGRMVKEKDFRTYFIALREILNQNDNKWCFIAIGDGPERIELMNEVKDLIEQGIVIFAKPGIEVLKIISKAHVGVLMSHPLLHAEGCSNTIMEFMACGLPVVCSDSGGNSELVINGKTGFLIPSGDSKALAEKLLFLKRNPKIGMKMGNAGQERLHKEFTIDKMVKKTISVYEEVMNFNIN